MLVVDPMLATGSSLLQQLTNSKQTNPSSMKFVCLLAAPEELPLSNITDVPVYTAAIDERWITTAIFGMQGCWRSLIWNAVIPLRLSHAALDSDRIL